MRRREWRERVSHRLFGHGIETMIGVAAVIVGGLFGGMTIVSIARDGFNFERIAGGVALSVIPIWFGLFFFPERRNH